MRLVTVAAGALLATVGVGCGGGGNGGAGTGAGGQVVAGTMSNGVITVPVSIDGSGALPFVLDTGAPLTLVDPSRFPAGNVSPGTGAASTLSVGGVHLMDVEIIGASPCGVMMCSSSAPAGLLGGDVLVDFDITINYRAPSVGFNLTAPPTGVGQPITTPFDLEGGGHVVIPGTAGSVTVPATRIAIDVMIEGATYPFVLDTGSSQVVLRPDLYDSIVADGRPQSTTSVSTVTGTTNQPTTELHSVALAGATQTNVAAVRSPLNLDALSAEVGHTIDGLLGGSYLSHYLVSIDYPGRQITLRAN
jgi:hypothetical protein